MSARGPAPTYKVIDAGSGALGVVTSHHEETTVDAFQPMKTVVTLTIKFEVTSEEALAAVLGLGWATGRGEAPPRKRAPSQIGPPRDRKHAAKST